MNNLPSQPAYRPVLFLRAIILSMGLCLFILTGIQAQDIKERGGVYYAGSVPYSGVYREHYDNGKARISMTLKNGLKDGETRTWYENGTLQEIRFYRNNLMDGTWTTYNEQGVKVAVAGYQEGKKHGEWKIWNDKGRLIYEMYYTNGEKSGTWKHYNDSTGVVISERKY